MPDERQLRKYRIRYTNEKRGSKFIDKDIEIVEAYSGKEAIEIMKKKYPGYRFSNPIWLKDRNDLYWNIEE